MNLENLITIEEFAKMANVTHQAIYDLIIKKILPSDFILGRRVIDITNKDIKAYLIKNKGKS